MTRCRIERHQGAAAVHYELVAGDGDALHRELAVGESGVMLDVGDISHSTQPADVRRHTHVSEGGVERGLGALGALRRRGQSHVLLQPHPHAAHRHLAGIEYRMHDEAVVVDAPQDDTVDDRAPQGLAHLLATHPGGIADTGADGQLPGHQHRVADLQAELPHRQQLE